MMDSETCTSKTQLEPRQRAAQGSLPHESPSSPVSHPNSRLCPGGVSAGQAPHRRPADVPLATPHYLSYIPQVTGPTLQWQLEVAPKLSYNAKLCSLSPLTLQAQEQMSPSL